MPHSLHRCLSKDNHEYSKRIYWHRELPPNDAEMIGEYTVEATSFSVPGTLDHRDDLWDCCYRDLMTQTEIRLLQEISRLKGDIAHILEESVSSRHDDVKGETWLHGQFSYALYRRSISTKRQIPPIPSSVTS